MKTLIKVGKTLNNRFVAINPEHPQTFAVLIGNDIVQKETNIPLDVFNKTIEISDNPLEVAIQLAIIDGEKRSIEWQLSNYAYGIKKLQDWKDSLTASKLRKLLAAAEKKANQEKANEKVIKSIQKKISKLSAVYPKHPLKGRDNARVDWQFTGHNKLAEKIWSLIPLSHKSSIASRRTGGYFSHSRVISPEANEILKLDELNKI